MNKMTQEQIKEKNAIIDIIKSIVDYRMLKSGTRYLESTDINFINEKLKDVDDLVRHKVEIEIQDLKIDEQIDVEQFSRALNYDLDLDNLPFLPFPMEMEKPIEILKQRID